MERYQVRRIRMYPKIRVTVPGSKSITNRALFLAAMAEGESILSGVLFSEDSLVFLEALRKMGVCMEVDQEIGRVVIQGSGGRFTGDHTSLYVGSAGTAARFLTAVAAMAEGDFCLDASEQMKRRPMGELLDVLRQLGADVVCLSEKDTFPVCVTGTGYARGQAEVSLNIDRSSQFLSALLMAAPASFDRLDIRLTGKRSARAYVEMTEDMMRQFGHPGVLHLSEDHYRVERAAYQAQEYMVEPDVSAACYFYAMAAVTGGQACVANMKKDSLQGDMKFLHVLEQMGCRMEWIRGELYLRGPEPGELKGVDVDMADFSDQALTLAAIAPYANSPVHIRNVGHIRGQECDRLHAVCENLGRMKVKHREERDGVWIWPSMPQPASVDPFHDHRVAMAFAITGLRADGIAIEDPQCCGKTFGQYFQVLDQVIDDTSCLRRKAFLS